MWISSEEPVIIAEIGMTHEGSLGLAINMAQAAHDAGATCVKFQTHFASAESSLDDEWRVNFSYQDRSRYDYWKRTEFSVYEWRTLFDICESRGIHCISSPFSLKACSLLKSLKVKAWKVGSGEATNDELVGWILRRPEPVIISLGLTDYERSDRIIENAKKINKNRKIILMHCVSKYPTPAEDTSLDQIDVLKRRYGDLCEIGLSDHSNMISPTILAIARGVRVIEVHFTISKYMFGPDVVASHDISSLTTLVSEARYAYRAVRTSSEKSSLLEEMTRMRKIFSRSLCFSRNLEQGHVVTKGDLSFLKPGGGLGYEQRSNLIGRALRKSVAAKSQVKLSDFV